jgi:acetyl esterase/lipase
MFPRILDATRLPLSRAARQAQSSGPERGCCLPEKASGPLPVIVWVHGGGWKDGNKDWRRAVPLVPKG